MIYVTLLKISEQILTMAAVIQLGILSAADIQFPNAQPQAQGVDPVGTAVQGQASPSGMDAGTDLVATEKEVSPGQIPVANQDLNGNFGPSSDYQPDAAPQGGYPSQGRPQGELYGHQGHHQGYPQGQSGYRPQQGNQGYPQGQGGYRPQEGYNQGHHQGYPEGGYRPHEGHNQGHHQGYPEGGYRPHEAHNQGHGGYRPQQAYHPGYPEYSPFGRPVYYPSNPIYLSGLGIGALGSPALYPAYPAAGNGGVQIIPVGGNNNPVIVIPTKGEKESGSATN